MTKYLYLWGVAIVLILEIVYYYLIYYFGRIVKNKYPERYEKQLTPQNATYPTLSFPFNFGMPFARGRSHIEKIIEIAKVENNNTLLGNAQFLDKIVTNSIIINLIIILGFALLGFWYL
jgi:hypothetical protein